MPEEEFYGLLKISDAFDLIWLDDQFTTSVAAALASHPLVSNEDLERLGHGHPYSSIEERITETKDGLPLKLRDGRTVGCTIRAHDQDAILICS